jgi:hypothetical protein
MSYRYLLESICMSCKYSNLVQNICFMDMLRHAAEFSIFLGVTMPKFCTKIYTISFILNILSIITPITYSNNYKYRDCSVLGCKLKSLKRFSKIYH